MPVRDEELVRIEGFPDGMDQVSREDKVPLTAARLAVNVDFDNEGKPRRRPGYAQVINRTECHSLYSNGEWPYLFYVSGSTLYAAETSNYTETAITTGFSPTREVSYCYVNDKIYLSDSQKSWQIDSDLSVRQWGIDAPFFTFPETPGTTTGRMVAMTYVRGSGEESGAPYVQHTTQTTISLPTSSDPSVLYIRVYVSADQGEDLYLQAELPNGTATYTIDTQPKIDGGRLGVELADKVPPAHIVRYFNGRIYMAVGSTVMWTDPLNYGVFHLDENYVQYPECIDLMEPVGESGIYVASGTRTYFLRGNNPDGFVQSVVHTKSAVPGTGIQMDGSLLGLETDERVAYWWSQAGYPVIGTPDGRIVPVRQRQIAADVGDRGATLYREHEGVRQLVTTMQPTKANQISASDSVIATITKVDP